MTKFSAIAYTSEGKSYIKHIDLPAWEVVLAVKVLLGVTPIVGAYYAGEWTVRVVLIATGLTILIATIIATHRLLARDVEAHRACTVTTPQLPLGVSDAILARTIPLNSAGVTTNLVMDAKDDELVRLVTKLLDASIKLSSPDVTTFPTTRALDWKYPEYDAALRALGIMVKRGRGVTPVLTFPHTLGTMREAIVSGKLLPFRSDASPSWNRIK